MLVPSVADNELSICDARVGLLRFLLFVSNEQCILARNVKRFELAQADSKLSLS